MEPVTTDELVRVLAITAVRLEKAAQENDRLARELTLARCELDNTRALAAALQERLSAGGGKESSDGGA